MTLVAKHAERLLGCNVAARIDMAIYVCFSVKRYIYGSFERTLIISQVTSARQTDS